MLLRQLGFLFSRQTKGNRKEIFFKGILLVWSSQINQIENAKMASNDAPLLNVFTLLLY